MSPRSKYPLALALLAAFRFTILSASAAGVDAGPYAVAQTYHAGGVGGMDYLTADAKSKLLFIPRVTHTMVLDAATGKLVADVPGQKHNHGVALVPGVGRGFITDGDDASVMIFDLKTYAVLGKIKAEADADGIIYDPASNKVLLVSGDAGVLIPISPDVDPANGKADAEVDLGGKPEFLAADGQGRVYINLVDKNEVAVMDTKTMAVVAKWPTAPGGSPVGMAMDRVHRRLFIGCRKPPKMIVMSADDGKVLADLPIGSGVDATQFDGDAFASCGDGTLAVVRETSPGKFEIVQSLKTAPRAKTMGLDPDTHTLYLPTAEFVAPPGGGRPVAKPGTFMVLVVKPSAP
jgi:hypothetical protein